MQPTFMATDTVPYIVLERLMFEVWINQGASL